MLLVLLVLLLLQKRNCKLRCSTSTRNLHSDGQVTSS